MSLLKDKSIDKKSTDLFRVEKFYPESEIRDYSICPDHLLSEKMAIIEAQIRKLKGLSPVKGEDPTTLEIQTFAEGDHADSVEAELCDLQVFFGSGDGANSVVADLDGPIISENYGGDAHDFNKRSLAIEDGTFSLAQVQGFFYPPGFLKTGDEGMPITHQVLSSSAKPLGFVDGYPKVGKRDCSGDARKVCDNFPNPKS
ncbi:hypothetical protein U1Q18_032645 [Sarracenia purpurea var. burkii]